MINPFASLWDRLFNRWETTIEERGSESWNRYTTYLGAPIGEPRPYTRTFVIYRHTHRFSKVVRLEKVYLD